MVVDERPALDMAQMPGAMSQADAVAHRAVGSNERPGVVTAGFGTHQYYRQRNGWIKLAAIGKVRDGEGAMERTYRGRGWTPLPQYGRYQFNDWQLEHPLENLFIAGGAHEVLLDQIQQQGWDKRPPEIPWCKTAEGPAHQGKYNSQFHGNACFQHMIPIEFPQLAGVQLETVEACDFCERDDLPTNKARQQHMYVMHNKELSEIRMGQRMAEALSQSTRTMMKTDKYVCGDCGEGFSAINKLGTHMKIHEESTD